MGEFSKQSTDEPPRKTHKEEPRKLTKLSEADYEEMRQYDAKQRRSVLNQNYVFLKNFKKKMQLCYLFSGS